MTLCQNDLIKLFKSFSMPQLSTYENTSKIWMNTNKNRSLNKEEIEKLEIEKFTYMYYRLNNKNDKNENRNDHGQS